MNLRPAICSRYRCVLKKGIGLFATAAILLTFSSRSNAQDTNSPNQLTINGVTLSSHCVPGQGNGLPFQGPDGRTLTIVGINFTNGATPIVTLGNVTLNLVSFTSTQIVAGFNCGDFSAGTYRLRVSTGNGAPYNDTFAFSLASQGPPGLNGQQGPKGDTGAQGPNGLNGNDGKDGAPGQNGHDGNNGKNGENGRGHHVVNTQLLPGQGGCVAGGVELDFYDIAADGTATLTDTKILCHGNNGGNGKDGAPGQNGKDGNNGANGKDGAPGQNGKDGNNGANGRDGAPGLNGQNGPQGQQGPAGVAKGWHTRFSSINITSTNVTVLSQTVTGTPYYLIDAKLNVPFGNNAKAVTCSLNAVENGVTTTIDTLDQNLIGNTQNTAKGALSLEGVYAAIGGASANVTVNVVCATGGDTRTVSNGRLNIVGANSLN